MADIYDFHPALDLCPLCGGAEFSLDEVHCERSCTECGCCGPLAWSLPVMYAAPPKTYSKHTYFKTRALADMVVAGAGINRREMELAATLHTQCVNRFYATQHLHKRKSFLHNGFVLIQIGKKMGIDFSSFVKMPKLKATIARLQNDWDNFIKPW